VGYNTEQRSSYTQGDPVGKVGNLGRDSIGHHEKKKRIWTCAHFCRAVGISRPNSVRFFSLGGGGWGSEEERSLRKTNCSFAFWMLLHAKRNVKFNAAVQKTVIFLYELRSSLRQRLGFSDVFSWTAISFSPSCKNGHWNINLKLYKIHSK